MNGITLSIIIPHYNSALMLKDLLQSILKECSETEILVVDDNSTKELSELEEVKKEYSDRVVFLVNNSGTKGAGAARNVALKVAKGDWIMFADADDWFNPGWFEAVSKYFDSNYDAVYYDPVSWDVANSCETYRGIRMTRGIKKMLEGDKTGVLDTKYLTTTIWSRLIRRGIIYDNNLTFDETMHANDVIFTTKSSFYSKNVIADPARIYSVTLRPGTLTQNMSEEAFRMRLEILCRRNIFLRENLPSKDYKYIVKYFRAFDRIVAAENRHYGAENIKEYKAMLKEAKVPLMPSRLELYRRNRVHLKNTIVRTFRVPLSKVKHFFLDLGKKND